jgi:inositol polyphosphate 1-phosphatase
MGTRFLELLLKASEKAANIARVIRQDEHLFKLLVQEKKGSEKNPRFVQDFKTLADVLIQETVKHDVGIQVSVLIF